jgi:hypothetical protein
MAMLVSIFHGRRRSRVTFMLGGGGRAGVRRVRDGVDVGIGGPGFFHSEAVR